MESQYEMLFQFDNYWTTDNGAKYVQSKLSVFKDHQGVINVNAEGWNDYQDWDTIRSTLPLEQARKLYEALCKVLEGQYTSPGKETLVDASSLSSIKLQAQLLQAHRNPDAKAYLFDWNTNQFSEIDDNLWDERDE